LWHPKSAPVWNLTTCISGAAPLVSVKTLLEALLMMLHDSYPLPFIQWPEVMVFNKCAELHLSEDSCRLESDLDSSLTCSWQRCNSESRPWLIEKLISYILTSDHCGNRPSKNSIQRQRSCDVWCLFEDSQYTVDVQRRLPIFRI
jgi:hypothetical protein